MKEDDLALRLEPGDIPCDNSEDDDETMGSLSVKDDENGASCRTKITPGTNESDSESLAKIRLANNNLEDDASTEVSTISEDASEVRLLRISHTNDWLTDERVQDVIDNIQTVIRHRDDKSDAVKMICNMMIEAQQGMDSAFAAGTLATPAGIARPDSEQYAERLNDEDAKTAIDDARDHLKKSYRED